MPLSLTVARHAFCSSRVIPSNRPLFPRSHTPTQFRSSLNISSFTDMFAGAMRELVLIGKALADATRVRILAALRGRELCVCELCDALEVSQSTLSTHLQVIRDAGLVQTRKQGKWTYYAPAPERDRL